MIRAVLFVFLVLMLGLGLGRALLAVDDFTPPRDPVLEEEYRQVVLSSSRPRHIVAPPDMRGRRDPCVSALILATGMYTNAIGRDC